MLDHDTFWMYVTVTIGPKTVLHEALQYCINRSICPPNQVLCKHDFLSNPDEMMILDNVALNYFALIVIDFSVNWF